jgi:hypothetical protein
LPCPAARTMASSMVGCQRPVTDSNMLIRSDASSSPPAHWPLARGAMALRMMWRESLAGRARLRLWGSPLGDTPTHYPSCSRRECRSRRSGTRWPSCMRPGRATWRRGAAPRAARPAAAGGQP